MLSQYRITAALLLSCVQATALAGSEAPRRGTDSPIVFAQVPPSADLEERPGSGGGTLRSGYGDGARVVRLDPDGRLSVLTRGFSSACELDVSFDARHILVAAKRNPRDAWDIWEMNTDGSDARQITRDLGNCRSPAYQATLYTLASTEPWYQIMFISDAAGAMNESGSGPSTALYSCRLDGSTVRRLTMNLSNDQDPFLTDDGRVLLASWQRMDLQRGARGRVALFGVNTDGADYALFAGDEGARVKHMPCSTPGGLVVFVEADRVGWDGAGQLACVTLRRSHHSHRPITSDARYLYHSPSPLCDGSVLASRRPAEGGGTHGIYRVDPHTGEAELIFDDPGFHDVHARALVPRPEPDGRSSVVDETRYDSGILYCLNAYLTEPARVPHMQPGMIRRVRVLEGVPLPAAEPSLYPSNADQGGISGLRSTVNGIPPVVQRRLLGEVPVEPDGSFQIEVPPDVPIQLQTLDEDGMALRSCGWIWVKHHEPRGCIGCHEDPELTPENRLVEAVTKPAIRLMLPPQKRRVVDFRRDVMPIIAQRCSSQACHGGDRTPLNLGPQAVGPYNQAYVGLLAGVTEALARGADGPVGGKYVHPGQARTSVLIWRLFDRNTSRPWDPGGGPAEKLVRMPPHPDGEPLSDEQTRTFVEWIDLGALWDGIPGADELAKGTVAEPQTRGAP